MAFKLLIVSGLMVVIAFVGGIIMLMKGNSEARSKTMIAIAFLIIAAMWGWYFKVYRPTENAGEETIAAIANDPCISQTKAYYASRKFVEVKLKSPSSASFPTDQGISVTQPSACRFLVKARVEATNTYGVMLRSSYFMDLQYLPAAKKYQLNELRIE